jgi:enoyl-CoA hydratase/carnithine racemase
MAIILEREDGVATITLNRPEAMNAMDPDTYEEIGAAFLEIEEADDVLVGIITGAGDRAFTAGADLKLMHTGEQAGKPPADSWRPWRPSRWDFGLTTSKPLIAAINGYALAGGLELALLCDIRIASPNAQFGTPEVKWNLLHGYGTYKLPRIVSLSYAMELLLTGEFIGADEAARIGLISRVVPADQLMQEARRLAFRIRDNGPMAIRMTKELVQRGLSGSLEDHFRLMHEYYDRVEVSAQQKEGLTAFREKRPPNYRESSESHVGSLASREGGEGGDTT